MSRRRSRTRARFALMHAKYGRAVARAAHRLSYGDRDLADDLVQEGLIAMWRLADRTPAATKHGVFVRRAIVNAMKNFRRWEAARQMIESGPNETLGREEDARCHAA